MIPDERIIKELLDRKVFEYNRSEFIPDDPVSVPHRFTRKEDVEISGFLTAIISWGQRKTIIRNAITLMEWMDDSPYEFIVNCNQKELVRFHHFKHRTFNGADCIFFLKGLQNIYRSYGGLEKAFTIQSNDAMAARIQRFRNIFLSAPHPERSSKHLADPTRGSSAKRIIMFLRWMVRRDECGVDFGIWKGIYPSQLYCPLDVHTGATARRLGILSIRTNNWKAVEELTGNLRRFDPDDPARYDFALFGIGMYERG